VSPHAHGLGIGTKLYREYESTIAAYHDEIDSILIDTQRNNIGAIQFFTRLGFKLDDTFVVYSKSEMTPTK